MSTINIQYLLLNTANSVGSVEGLAELRVRYDVVCSSHLISSSRRSLASNSFLSSCTVFEWEQYADRSPAWGFVSSANCRSSWWHSSLKRVKSLWNTPSVIWRPGRHTWALIYVRQGLGLKPLFVPAPVQSQRNLHIVEQSFFLPSSINLLYSHS